MVNKLINIIKCMILQQVPLQKKNGNHYLQRNLKKMLCDVKRKTPNIINDTKQKVTDIIEYIPKIPKDLVNTVINIDYMGYIKV